MMSLAYFLVWSYALKRRLVDPGGDPNYFAAIQMTYGGVIVYTLVALGICFVSTLTAGALYALMFGVFAFPKEFATKVAEYRAARSRH